MAIKKIILANPRGFCAGVVRAIEIVEQAMEILPPPKPTLEFGLLRSEVLTARGYPEVDGDGPEVHRPLCTLSSVESGADDTLGEKACSVGP